MAQYTCPTCNQPLSDEDSLILSLAAGDASIDEIAARIGKSPRTVQRVLKRFGSARDRGRPRKTAVAEK